MMKNILILCMAAFSMVGLCGANKYNIPGATAITEFTGSAYSVIRANGEYLVKYRGFLCFVKDNYFYVATALDYREGNYSSRAKFYDTRNRQTNIPLSITSGGNLQISSKGGSVSTLVKNIVDGFFGDTSGMKTLVRSELFDDCLHLKFYWDPVYGAICIAPNNC